MHVFFNNIQRKVLNLKNTPTFFRMQIETIRIAMMKPRHSKNRFLLVYLVERFLLVKTFCVISHSNLSEPHAKLIICKLIHPLWIHENPLTSYMWSFYGPQCPVVGMDHLQPFTESVNGMIMQSQELGSLECLSHAWNFPVGPTY